jgi:hypothetical protein
MQKHWPNWNPFNPQIHTLLQSRLVNPRHHPPRRLPELVHLAHRPRTIRSCLVLNRQRKFHFRGYQQTTKN